MTDFDCSKHRSNMSIGELDKCKSDKSDNSRENYRKVVGSKRK